MTKDELEQELTVTKEELRKQICEKDDMSVKLRAALAPLRRDTYSMAVRAYGKKSQLVMAMEEMSELTKELSKNMRGAKNISSISEEIADVEIMLEQLKIIFSNRAEVDIYRGNKLDRLVNRLAEGLE